MDKLNIDGLGYRFKEVYLDGTWIANTNLQDQLSQTSWQEATHRVNGLNTIALLTYHLNYYLEGILNVFNGGNLEIRDKYSFDCPEILSDEHWHVLVESLLNNAEKFAQHIVDLTELDLDADFVNPQYGSYRRNIEAVIEHGYYHLGQIVLIRKLI